MDNRYLLLTLTFLCTILVSVEATKQRLVVVLLDGMRWDYVARDSSLKTFQRIAKEGVRVEYVTPIFPSISYPNWYTIATGLYTESHGMIGNFMYDAVRNDSFDMSPDRNVAHEHWWNKTEPLWVTAEKNGRRTAMHYWDGCQVSIRGVKPTFCDSYKSFEGWSSVRKDTKKKLKGILDWFEKSENNRLGLVYYEGADAIGHKYGPESPELKEEVRHADDILEKFLEELDESKLKKDVNLMVVSDHGMTDIQNNEIIRMDDFGVNEMTDRFIGGGAYGAILPKTGQDEEVYRKLKERTVKGLTVYRRQEIPDRYHYKNGELTFPILMVADIGYYIAEPGSDIKKPKIAGTHGYDPYVKDSEMRTIMFARGPAFKRGVIGGPIDQTDHYNIFCHILDIKALPNNGSWDRVSKLLVQPDIIPENKGGTGTRVYINVVLVAIVSIFSLFA